MTWDRRRPADGLGALTPRAASRLAIDAAMRQDGATNKQIAAALGITVEGLRQMRWRANDTSGDGRTRPAARVQPAPGDDHPWRRHS